MWKEVGKRLILTQGRGQDGRIRKVLQESGRSSMYKVYNNVIPRKEEGDWDVVSCCKYLFVPDYFDYLSLCY
jgi:hypothetical protein